MYPTPKKDQKPFNWRNDCEICGNVKTLFIDHCHQCGEIRGQICPGCNVKMGHYDRGNSGYTNWPLLARYAKAHKCPALIPVAIAQAISG